jgi:hypothetical protein
LNFTRIPNIYTGMRRWTWTWILGWTGV